MSKTMTGRAKRASSKSAPVTAPPTAQSPRRTWTWKSPEPGYVRTMQVFRTAQRLHLEGAITTPINLEALRAWSHGQRRSAAAFPIPREQMRPFGNGFLYPEGSDILIAFWYDGRQRRNDEKTWRARMETYLAEHPQTDAVAETEPA